MATCEPKSEKARINLNPLFWRVLILQTWIVLSAKMFSMFYPQQQLMYPQQPVLLQYPPVYQPQNYPPPGYPGSPPPVVQEDAPQATLENAEQQGSPFNLGNVKNVASNLFSKAFGKNQEPQEQAPGYPQQNPPEGNGPQYIPPSYEYPQAAPQMQVPTGYPQQGVVSPQYMQAAPALQPNPSAYLPQQGAYYPQSGTESQQMGYPVQAQQNVYQQGTAQNPCFDTPAVETNDSTDEGANASSSSSESSLAKNLVQMANSPQGTKPGIQQNANENPQYAITKPIVSDARCVTYLPGGIPFVITSTNSNFQPISLKAAGGYIIVPVPDGAPSMPQSNTNQYAPPQTGYVNLPYSMGQ
jgi:hypothetical protein